jgi:hypothetical protein
MRTITLALLAAMLVAAPTAGQDFLQDFEEFVEDMLPERANEPAGGVSAPTRPTPPSVAPPVAPTTPTPRVERPGEESGEADDPPLPRPRPEGADQPVATEEPEGGQESVEPRPEETERIYQTACPALISGVVVGEMLGPIAEGQCGLRSPLRVTAVRINGSEIGFSSPVTTNCQLAGALADWLGEVDAYAGAALESGIATLNTGTSLMCRNRYGAEDGFVSEHGFGNAVDVLGFTLDNGETIGVETGWPAVTTPTGKLLRQAHGAACGRFTTVLGPEANDEHADHFHLDLGCHGQSCMAQICE